jgi:hypothetical protein
MHFSEGQKRSSASRAERPLSTNTICISPSARGLAKCEVYWVMRSPVALRVSRRMNTASSALPGMTFSIPIEQIRKFGTLPERSALPSLVTVTTAPVFATAKLAPVMPASAARISGRVCSRMTRAR